MKFKNLSSSVSVKTKTIILVLFVIITLSVIFFSIRYIDIKNFAKANQQMELKKVTHVYNETLKRVRKFYTTRGYANINSYGIKKAFEKKDIKALHDLSLPRWKIITKENRYLTTFAFYDNNGKLLTYFGQKAQLKLPYIKGKKFPYDGFWYGEGKFFYHTVSEARDKNSNIIGYVVFVIDPRYFLSQIRKLIDMDAYIYYDGYGQNLIFSLHGNDYVKKMIKNKKLSNFKEIKFKKRDYLTYIIKGRGINKKNDFKIIFFQDISNWRMILNKAILQGVIGIILFIIVTAVVINYGFDIILRQLDEVNTKLVNSQKELQKLNKNLQIRVEKEIKERLKKEREVNEKERILLHQSKLASMGEMIGNIAHQWRQPLTELSLILISMELHSERNNLTKEKFKLKIQEANEAIAFMSKTIDDFRNFFSSGKKKQNYKVSNLIEKIKKLIIASLKNNNIKLDIEIKDDFTLNGYPNEMAQAVLNIIVNAKDVIVQRGIRNGKIHVKTFTENSNKIILISDNAGGIKVIPIDKIFEPYFSTKHAKSGIGIGLYMTKTIIEKNNNGKLEVKNEDKGAVFTIIF